MIKRHMLSIANSKFAYTFLLLVSIFLATGCGDEPDVIDPEPLLIREAAFLKAASEGDVETVTQAIAEGIDVNVANEEEHTALMLSIIHNQKTVADLLLPLVRLDVNKKGPQDTTALIYAAHLSTNAALVRRLLLVAALQLDSKEETNGSTALIAAIRRKTPNNEAPHLELFEAIVDAHFLLGADINETDAAGNTALYYAAKQNQVPGIIKYLLTSPEIEGTAVVGDDLTPLALAILHNRGEVLSAMLGIDKILESINTVSQGKTPLGHALLVPEVGSRTNVIKALLKIPGIEANRANDDGSTLLHALAQDDDVPVLEALLSATGLEPPLDVNVKDNDGKTALHLMVQSNKVPVLEALLSATGLAPPLDVNVKDNDGKTPLHLIARSGNKAVLEALLSATGLAPPLDVNVKDNEEKTPLHHMVLEHDTLPPIKRFVDAALDVPGGERQHGLLLDVCDFSGKTPLNLLKARTSDAARSSEPGYIVEANKTQISTYLEGKGATESCTASTDADNDLLVAATAGNKEDLLAAIAAGANVNIVNAAGETLLILAIKSGNVDAVRAFLDDATAFNGHHKPPSRDATDPVTAYTPLVRAVRLGSAEMVSVLLENSVIASKKDDPVPAGGRTPLAHAFHRPTGDLAVTRATSGVVSALLDAEVDVNVKDSDEKTALHYAVLLQNTLLPIEDFVEGSRANDLDLKPNLCDGASKTALTLLQDRPSDSSAPSEDGYIVASNKTQIDNYLTDPKQSFQTNCNETVLEDVIWVVADLKDAIENGNLNVVRQIIEQGNVSVSDADSVGDTPLFVAIKRARRNKIPIIKALLEVRETDTGSRLSANRADNQGNIPLIFAARQGFSDVVKALLEDTTPQDAPSYVLNVNLTESSTGETALIAAARAGRPNVVEALLDDNTDQNRTLDTELKNDNGETALHWAASTLRYPNVVRKLLAASDERIYNLLAPSSDPATATPLVRAIRSNEARIVSVFLENSVIASEKDELVPANGKTPLAHAFHRPTGDQAVTAATADVLDALLDAGVDVNVEDGDGKTALHYAVMKQDTLPPIKRFVEAALDVPGGAVKHGLLLNVCDNDAKTALALLKARPSASSAPSAIGYIVEAKKAEIVTYLEGKGATETCPSP